MEDKLEKSADVGINVVFEEKITKSSSLVGEEEEEEEKEEDHVSGEEINNMGENQRQIFKQEGSSKPLSPNKKDSSSIFIQERDGIESAKAKMGEVKEENERLKLLLSKIVKDYQSLQMHFFDILQQEQEAAPNKLSNETAATSASHHDHDHEQSDRHHQLVSLSLGTSSGSSNHDQPKKQEKKSSNAEVINNVEGLELGLDCKFEPAAAAAAAACSTEKRPSSEELEEATEMWPPSKVLKTRDNYDQDHHVSVSDQQMNLKKARVSVRARCDTITMNDGCQWRKYGQKIAKGNPCPRAYYRCTVSPTCPVRKQVQRCVEDMSILITTYEGNHNHPLPLSATAMASTTSAAASMLQSQSSTSSSQSSAAANLHYNHFNNLSQHSRSPYHHQAYFPNSSISTNNSHPTITLDLTSPPNSSYLSNRLSNINAPRFPSTSLNFSSSSSWNASSNNTSSAQLSFGAYPARSLVAAGPFNHNYINNILGRQATQESQHHQQSLSAETITAAATMAITSNPSFRSALTAALMTSFVGVPRQNITASALENDDEEAVTGNIASSYLGKSSSSSSSMNSQQQQKQSLILFPTSKVTAPADESNNTK